MNIGQVNAIKNDGTVTYNAFNWALLIGEALPENVNVIPDAAVRIRLHPTNRGAFFQAIEDC